jgi:hypothetical protein
MKHSSLISISFESLTDQIDFFPFLKLKVLHMKKVIFILLTILVSVNSLKAQASVSADYITELQKMIKVSGQDLAFKASIDQMLNMYKHQWPDITDNQWTAITNELKTKSLNELIAMLAPVYVKHLNLEDLKELNEFYTSAIGKKLAKATPAITQESMLVGQNWGQTLMDDLRKAIDKLEK